MLPWPSNKPTKNAMIWDLLLNFLSWNGISNAELANTTPVNPPIVNKNMNPKANKAVTFNLIVPPYKVALGIHFRPSQALIKILKKYNYIASVFTIYIYIIYMLRGCLSTITGYIGLYLRLPYKYIFT